MTTRFRNIESLNELRAFVNETLCRHHELQPEAFRMTEKVLRRGNRPCGIHFCLHGPRAVKFTAIWETDRNQVLFYDANGERFLTTQLATPLSLDRSAA